MLNDMIQRGLVALKHVELIAICSSAKDKRRIFADKIRIIVVAKLFISGWF